MPTDTKKQRSPPAKAEAIRTQLAKRRTQAQSTKRQQLQDPSTRKEEAKRRLKATVDHRYQQQRHPPIVSQRSAGRYTSFKRK
uniref:Uncharacterized protein n=1 Tax=Tanacetum cinerariifolium TaxID=118510 RepID=A0A6L2LH71_TANCI|nr:hypothetical protein [Tanacetum cinerariifolium]